MQVSPTQIDYGVLFAWIVLALASLILISTLYRAVARSTPRPQPVSPTEPPKRYLFVSADVDEARVLLKRSVDDIAAGSFNNAVEKAHRAITDVLSQMLRYFSIDAKDIGVNDMLKALRENGVHLQPHTGLDRLNQILEKRHRGEDVTREDAHWAAHIAHFIIEASKEAPVTEKI